MEAKTISKEEIANLFLEIHASLADLESSLVKSVNTKSFELWEKPISLLHIVERAFDRTEKEADAAYEFNDQAFKLRKETLKRGIRMRSEFGF